MYMCVYISRKYIFRSNIIMCVYVCVYVYMCTCMCVCVCVWNVVRAAITAEASQHRNWNCCVNNCSVPRIVSSGLSTGERLDTHTIQTWRLIGGKNSFSNALCFRSFFFFLFSLLSILVCAIIIIIIMIMMIIIIIPWCH